MRFLRLGLFAVASSLVVAASPIAIGSALASSTYTAQYTVNVGVRESGVGSYAVYPFTYTATYMTYDYVNAYGVSQSISGIGWASGPYKYVTNGNPMSMNTVINFEPLSADANISLGIRVTNMKVATSTIVRGLTLAGQSAPWLCEWQIPGGSWHQCS